MTSTLELARWKLNIWLVRTHERFIYRWRELDYTAYARFSDKRRVMALLDRIDPFTPVKGFRYGWLRWLVSRITTPLFIKRDAYKRVTLILDRFAPYVGPGKFEANAISDRLKVEWLFSVTEYAYAEGGDVQEYGRWYAVFTDIDVPWSREPESWSISTDANGFVFAYQNVDAAAALAQFALEEHDYSKALEQQDDDEWTNREGAPEFNGAFGIER